MALVQEAPTNSAGAPVGYSGSIADNGQDCSACHSPSLNSPDLDASITITSDIEDVYMPGESYQFSINIDAPLYESFGFLATVENSSGLKVGEFQLIDAIQTQLVANGEYITHTNAGTNGVGQKSWTFNWVAPAFLQGDVTLYVSSLLTNNNGTNQGDEVLTASQTYLAPFLGCADTSAVNYNPLVTVDNGTCFYEYSNGTSSLSLSFESLVVVGTSTDYDVEIDLTVHNNSSVSKNVFVKRNIITNNIPTNWFCWSVCYLPMISESPTAIQIAPNSYTNNFSAHLAPFENVGTYEVEYCFYTEGNMNDSICATLEFIVEGDIWGCTNNNALNFEPEANADDGSCITYPFPNWDFNDEGYIDYHSVELPQSSAILIDGNQITTGDWVGVFYETDQGLICAGLTEWSEGANTIFAYDIDSLTPTGLIAQDEFVWQIWDASEGVSWIMDVEYNSEYPNYNSYSTFGVSQILSMSNINPISIQELNIAEGWSLFSSYMISPNMNVVDVFESNQDQVVIVKNNEGLAYIVAYNYNAIGDMIPGQGYLVKTTEEINLVFNGDYAKPELHPIFLQEGWNMIGYLNTAPENTVFVFSELVNENKIQIVKDCYGNAYLPSWNFNGLGDMEPGSAYQVKTFSDCILQY